MALSKGLNTYTKQKKRRMMTHIKAYIEEKYEALVMVGNKIENDLIVIVLPFDLTKRANIKNEVEFGFLAYMVKEYDLIIQFTDKNAV
jgi:hypothetical protein